MNLNFILAIIVIVIIAFISIYNKLIGMIESVCNNEKQIDIQLDRRYKVLQSLIDIVRKTMDYEKTTLKDVVALRQQAQLAKSHGDEPLRRQAEDQISQVASQIHLVFEQYPQLKATENSLQLQEEVVNTENKLTFAKQAYNDSIERYNAQKKSFFTGMVVGCFKNKLDKSFSYWQLSEADKESKEAYTVKL